jgi:cation diffusion facilitator CzcD-associated flavoprotein CzcO
VTMLQRSPSYILSQPATDGLEILIRAIFPTSWTHKLIRIKWLIVPYLFIAFCVYFPNLAKRMLRKGTIDQLPPSIAHDPHFKPSYDPFQQRMCFCPDGDFYASLRSGKASVVTGAIEKVTEKSIKLTDGQELHPDIIATATGLKIRLAGGAKLTVDGQPFHLNEKFIWKTVMVQDLPNVAFVVGYVDASWTLGADTTAQLICRLLKQMEKEGAGAAIPRLEKGEEGKMKEVPMLKLQSTYVKRAEGALPKAGDGAQWRARSTYFRDLWEAKFGDLKTGMQYISAKE